MCLGAYVMFSIMKRTTSLNFDRREMKVFPWGRYIISETNKVFNKKLLIVKQSIHVGFYQTNIIEPRLPS